MVWRAVGLYLGCSLVLIAITTWLVPSMSLGFEARTADAFIRVVDDGEEAQAIARSLYERGDRVGSFWTEIEPSRWVRTERYELQVMELRAALYSDAPEGAFLGAIWFLIPAIAVGAVYRRRLFREVGLAAVLALAAQVSLWFLSGEGMNPFGGGMVYLGSEGAPSILRAPAVMFIVMLSSAYWLVAEVGILASALVAERLTGVQHCPSCALPMQSQEMRQADYCARCKEPLTKAGVQWSWVIAGVAGTLLLFAVFLTQAGGPLNFFHDCTRLQGGGFPDICYEIQREMRGAAWADEYTSWFWIHAPASETSEQSEYRLLHMWRYLLFTAPLFALAPFLAAWRVKRSPLGTAGTMIPINWFGAAAVGMLVLARGTKAASLVIMKDHAVALVIWGIAGFIGAMIGHRLRRKDTFLEHF